MANKLDRDQIEALKAEGLSVRKIAERLSELSGAKVSPSSVHYMLSKENGNGESKESVQVDQALVLERFDYVQVRLDDLTNQISRTTYILQLQIERVRKFQIAVLTACVSAILTLAWLDGGHNWAGLALLLIAFGFLIWKTWDDVMSCLRRKGNQNFWISPTLAIRKEEGNNDRP